MARKGQVELAKILINRWFDVNEHYGESTRSLKEILKYSGSSNFTKEEIREALNELLSTGIVKFVTFEENFDVLLKRITHPQIKRNNNSRKQVAVG